MLSAVVCPHRSSAFLWKVINNQLVPMLWSLRCYLAATKQTRTQEPSLSRRRGTTDTRQSCFTNLPQSNARPYSGDSTPQTAQPRSNPASALPEPEAVCATAETVAPVMPNPRNPGTPQFVLAMLSLLLASCQRIALSSCALTASGREKSILADSFTPGAFLSF